MIFDKLGVEESKSEVKSKKSDSVVQLSRMY